MVICTKESVIKISTILWYIWHIHYLTSFRDGTTYRFQSPEKYHATYDKMFLFMELYYCCNDYGFKNLANKWYFWDIVTYIDLQRKLLYILLIALQDIVYK